MRRTPHYLLDDRDEVRRLIRENPWATIVSHVEGAGMRDQVIHVRRRVRDRHAVGERVGRDGAALRTPQVCDAAHGAHLRGLHVRLGDRGLLGRRLLGGIGPRRAGDGRTRLLVAADDVATVAREALAQA